MSLPARHPTSPRRDFRRGEAGYNMVVLMVAVTLLAIATAAALPMWTQVMKREKEAELISRGWQYAEAIRVFQQRHGRYPTRLEELMEVKPRSIRRLWPDPMTESGEWGLVFQGGVAEPGQGGRELGGGGGLDEGRGDREEREDRGRGGLRTPRPGERRTVGPIVGVRSLSEDESIKVLFDEQSYDKWSFTVDRIGGSQISGIAPGAVQRAPGPPQARPGPGGRPVLPRTEWIGKPFPPGLQPQGGGVPGAGGQQIGPDGRPRQTPPGNRSQDR